MRGACIVDHVQFMTSCPACWPRSSQGAADAEKVGVRLAAAVGPAVDRATTVDLREGDVLHVSAQDAAVAARESSASIPLIRTRLEGAARSERRSQIEYLRVGGARSEPGHLLMRS